MYFFCKFSINFRKIYKKFTKNLRNGRAGPAAPFRATEMPDFANIWYLQRIYKKITKNLQKNYDKLTKTGHTTRAVPVLVIRGQQKSINSLLWLLYLQNLPDWRQKSNLRFFFNFFSNFRHWAVLCGLAWGGWVGGAGLGWLGRRGWAGLCGGLGRRGWAGQAGLGLGRRGRAGLAFRGACRGLGCVGCVATGYRVPLNPHRNPAACLLAGVAEPRQCQAVRPLQLERAGRRDERQVGCFAHV